MEEKLIPQEALESNKLIAEFVDVILSNYTTYDGEIPQRYHINDLKYHSSWDWLMPVVEKIEDTLIDLVNDDRTYYDTIVTAEGSICSRIEHCDKKYYVSFGHIYEFGGNNKLETTYKAIIEFIKWYNSQKEN